MLNFLFKSIIKHDIVLILEHYLILTNKTSLGKSLTVKTCLILFTFYVLHGGLVHAKMNKTQRGKREKRWCGSTELLMDLLYPSFL